jgi:hypothetical protein
MIAIDLNDLPIHRENRLMWGQFGWLASPPAIVETVDNPWDYLDLSEGYRCDLEIILNEQNGVTQVERYLSENGTVVAIENRDTDHSVDENSLSEKLETIKSHFGIGVKHLAAALEVERPTVYAWMKGERLPQQKRWDRIQTLLELANYWQGLSQYPLSRRIFVPSGSGQSVIDLLSAVTLDTPRIKQLLKSLATDENERSVRLSEKAVAMRERMKAKGVEPLSEDVVNQSMRSFENW